MGRSPYADIVIADPSVAEYHAEIVVADDDTIFVVDCGTASGTWRLLTKDGRSSWKPIRQAFVGEREILRFGDHECAMSDVLSPVLPNREAPGKRIGRDAIPPGGRLSRDPRTGEIVRRGR